MLGPKTPTVRIESFRDTPENKARIVKIMKSTKATHSDVMRDLVRRGLESYEGEV